MNQLYNVLALRLGSGQDAATMRSTAHICWCMDAKTRSTAGDARDEGIMREPEGMLDEGRVVGRIADVIAVSDAAVARTASMWGGQLQTLVAVNTESIIYDKDHRAYATLVRLEQCAHGKRPVSDECTTLRNRGRAPATCLSAFPVLIAVNSRLKSIYANDVKLALRCPWSEAGGEWGVACNYGATTKNYGVRRELRNFGQTTEHYVDGTLHYDHYSNYSFSRQSKAKYPEGKEYNGGTGRGWLLAENKHKQTAR
ncbi:hypothetical protein C8R45DRAFT_1065914 [Mycena sanguinolenta]|nr:hypothetical protein C8R45DRAFT_1065914 [Mycena sanguinolenta]